LARRSLRSLPPLLLGLGPALAPLPNGGGLQPGRDPIEHIDGAEAEPDEVGVPVEQAGEVAGHPALAVHERCSIRTSDHREELIDGVIGIDGHGPALQQGGVELIELYQVGQVHSHACTSVVVIGVPRINR